jgi:Glu-tRNA(Gln) amidotransferase subunit E-like FAD-binding protein
MNPETEAVAIEDAMRIVSVRMPVTDYGRLRALAKRLRVRESVAFRLVLQLALRRLESFYDGRLQGHALLPTLAEFGDSLAREGLDAERMTDALNRELGPDEPRLSVAEVRAALQGVA